MKKIIANNYNILLVGNTNVGKSTLINEFLNLSNSRKAKEGDGGPTQTIDFTPYKAQKNNKNFTLFDTNGITNNGENSIDKKKQKIIDEIEKRLKNKDPNELIHCIWYCFEGSNIQPSDKELIENLLNIYTTYSIPIIYIHSQTYSKAQSNTCKNGIKKYLKEIYNNDLKKVEQQLNNYINILARGNEEEEREAFGLDELEKLSLKEIELKGLKSSYFEYLKQDIIPILINGVFTLIFTDDHIKNLVNHSKESLEKFLNNLKNIINNDNLGLTQEVKNENKKSIEKLFNYFKNIRENLKDDLKDLLTVQKMKKNNIEFIKNFYAKKDEKYKNNISYEKFCDKVEDLIYGNMASKKEEIINNFLNAGFISFIIHIIKTGINEQFKSCEEKILNEIYIKIFNESNIIENNNEIELV